VEVVVNEPGECRNCGHALTMDHYRGRMRYFNIIGEFIYDTDEWLCPGCEEINVDTIRRTEQ
jgi:hypothetical protein